MDNGLPTKSLIKATRDDYYSIYFEKIVDLCGGRIVVKKEVWGDSGVLGQNARRELFLWAIFVERFDLAKYLCSKTWVR